jgi:hypothetical protein
MILDGNAVNITAEGLDAQLFYYSMVNGTGTWHPETIVGGDSAFWSPTMILNGDTVDVTAVNAGAGLSFYWTYTGNTNWRTETVAPNGSLG